MTAKILNGTETAQQLRDSIASQIQERLKAGRRAPALAVVLVGDNRASEVYVKNKKIACAAVGINTVDHKLPSNTDQKDLLNLIHKLNNDPKIDGILVQLPLPAQIDASAIIESINPSKDVDGFHPYNLGRLAQGRPAMRPCTPAGVMLLLETTKQNFVGKHAVVIGRSNIVGLPMLLELVNAKITVTSCGKDTKDLAQQVRQADILIVATGNPELIKGSWINPGATVIDIGMNHRDDGSLVGDVEFNEASKHAAWITPVPGGVGPMTVAVLLHNTLTANIAADLRETEVE